MNNETHTKEVWNELRLMQDSSTKAWQIYMSWFTSFFGTNLIALSWVVTTTARVRNPLILALASLMIFVCVAGVGGSLMIFRYSVACGRTAQLLSAGTISPSGAILKTNLFIATPLTKYAPLANILALSLAMLVWAYVAYSKAAV